MSEHLAGIADNSKVQPAAPAFDFGTSPHGLSAELHRTDQETGGASSCHPPAKPVLTFGGDDAGGDDAGCGRASDRTGTLPMVYRQTRKVCRAIREAFSRKPHDVHYLRLDDRAFLQVYSAIERDRSRTRKAIGKGIADHQDLRASDPLWQILQDVMTRRMRGYKL